MTKSQSKIVQENLKFITEFLQREIENEFYKFNEDQKENYLNELSNSADELDRIYYILNRY